MQMNKIKEWSEDRWKNTQQKKKENENEAPGEDRTHDLSLTKGTHYHYATEALAFVAVNYLSEYFKYSYKA